ncbi:MAG: helix-turn-helix domain-containing protein [Rhizomicrobium sp.]
MNKDNRPPLIMLNLVSAMYWFDEALQAGLEAKGWGGFSRAQSLILTNIAIGEHRASQIARNLGVTRQAISQMLADLEKKGVVSVKPDRNDARARVAKFSTKSAGLRDAAMHILTELEETLAGRIGARKMKGLREGLLAEWGVPPRPLSRHSIKARPRAKQIAPHF